MVTNPNKPLRTAYVNKLRTATNLPVYAMLLPKDIKPVPKQYVLISSQTKNITEESKNLTGAPLEANKFEWLCTITIDINYVSENGFAKPEKNDGIEELIVAAIQEGIQVSGFTVKSYQFFSSVDLDIATQTQYIERRMVTYQHWLCQQQDV